MKTLLIILTLLSHGILLTAHSKTLDSKDLEQLLKKYQNIQTLDVDFEQIKVLKSVGIKIDSEGHLSIKPDKKIIWEISKPDQLIVTLSGDEMAMTTRTDGKSDTQVLKLKEMSKEQGAQNFSALFVWLTLDAKEIHKAYEVSTKDDKQYDFIPKEKNQPFTKITMSIGPESTIKGLRMHEQSGDELNIQFKKPKLTYRK
jgi:outer membrane lipoprotein-sorting protein